MQKVILALLALCVSGWGAIGALTIPHEIDSAAIPKVIYIDQNNDSIINKVNEIKDTVNGLAAGTAAFSGLTASSLVSTNASKQLTSTLPSAVTFPGTVTTTGVHTFTAAPVFSTSASRIMWTNGSGTLSTSSNLAYDGTTITMGSGNSITAASGATSLGSTLVVASSITQSAGTTAFTVDDNAATAWEVQQGSNEYLKVTTTNSSEAVAIGNATTNPSFTFLGTGDVTMDSLVSAKFYTEGSFTIAGTGFSACSQGVLSGSTCTATAYYVRVGKAVTLYIPQLSGTSNATTFTLTGIPAAIRPARVQNVTANTIHDNGTQYMGGSLDVATDGTILIWRTVSINATLSTWTASGTKAIYYNTVAYNLL